MNRLATAGLATSLFLCLVVIAVSQRAQTKKPGDRVSPALAGHRNPEEAIAQAKKLMLAYIEAGRDWSKIDANLLRHPDQKLVEGINLRAANAFMPLYADAFYDGQIAFTCSMYAQRNLVYKGGDEIESSPSGFFIVGYENGAIRKVPVKDVRYYQIRLTKNGVTDDVWKHVFPGMPQYAIADDRPGVRHDDAPEMIWQKPTRRGPRMGG